MSGELSIDSVRQALAQLREPGNTITPRLVIHPETYEKVREQLEKSVAAFAATFFAPHPGSLLGLEVAKSLYVHPGLAYLVKRDEYRAELGTIEVEPYPVPMRYGLELLPRASSTLYLNLSAYGDEPTAAQRFERLKAALRSARARSRRRARYEIREAILCRRLGITPTPWRGR